jgi:hypothetical protein
VWNTPDFSARTVTVPPDSLAVTVIVGVASLVMLSVSDVPESEPSTTSGVLVASGATVSDVEPVVNVKKVVLPQPQKSFPLMSSTNPDSIVCSEIREFAGKSDMGSMMSVLPETVTLLVSFVENVSIDVLVVLFRNKISFPYCICTVSSNSRTMFAFLNTPVAPSAGTEAFISGPAQSLAELASINAKLTDLLLFES